MLSILNSLPDWTYDPTWIFNWSLTRKERKKMEVCDLDLTRFLYFVFGTVKLYKIVRFYNLYHHVTQNSFCLCIQTFICSCKLHWLNHINSFVLCNLFIFFCLYFLCNFRNNYQLTHESLSERDCMIGNAVSHLLNIYLIVIFNFHFFNIEEEIKKESKNLRPNKHSRGEVDKVKWDNWIWGLNWKN